MPRCKSHRPTPQKLKQRREQAMFAAEYRARKAKDAQHARNTAEHAEALATERAERARLDSVEKAEAKTAKATAPATPGQTPDVCRLDGCNRSRKPRGDGNGRLPWCSSEHRATLKGVQV